MLSASPPACTPTAERRPSPLAGGDPAELVALLAETFLGRYVVRLYLAHASLPPPRGPGHPGAFELASFAFYSKSVLYGAFVRARRALKHRKRRSPARADTAEALRHLFWTDSALRANIVVESYSDAKR